MARQPLIWVCSISLVGALSCKDDPPYEGAFDLPVGAAVLPTTRSAYSEPVALVANAHGGQIVPLALKQGRFLTDDPTASFLRGNWLPTGGARVLSSIALFAPDPFEISAFVGDRAFETLVQAPWVVGSEPSQLNGTQTALPVGPEPEVLDACFVPAGASWDPLSGEPCPGGDVASTLGAIEIKKGYTTTETWTLSWAEDRDRWRVSGSRSGRQEFEAIQGEPYRADKRRVAFTVRGATADLTEGDRFVFRTETGVIEHDVGGIPEVLAMSPDHSLLAMIVHDTVSDTPVVRWFDPVAGAVAGDVSLAASSKPVRLAWSEDGSALWVADANHPAAWEVDPSSGTAIEHPLPWPTLDIAPLDDGETRRLFVVPELAQSVWMMDVDTDDLLDINASVEGIQGMFFGTVVTGITAIPVEYRYQQTREVRNQKRLKGRSVAVALSSGRVVFMEEESGCLTQDYFGPRTLPNNSFGVTESDVTSNFDLPFGPQVEQNFHNDRHVIVNPCAGIATAESWTLRYDQAVGAWRVRSTQHGDHNALALEDQRYLSDNGEVSFTIRAGAIPSQDGWTFEFTVNEGAISANGDNNGDGQREVQIGVPGDPVFFHYLAGQARQPELDWDSGVIRTIDGRTDRPYVLVPAMASDRVVRISPETGFVETRWD